MSIPASHRLTRRPDFLLCYDAGRRFYSRNFVLFVLRREENSGAWRLGITVTRKTGNAVKRNRVRRLLREAFRLHTALFPHGIDMVILPKRGLNPDILTLRLVEQELLPLFASLAGRSRGRGSSPAS